MNLLLSIVARLAGVFYAATTGVALYRVLTAPKGGLSPLQAGLLAAFAGLMFQLGLLVAPAIVHRSSRARATVGVLMIPGVVLLVALFLGGLDRWPRGMSMSAVAVVGLVVYAVQYFLLWRAHRMTKGSVRPAV